MEGFTFGLEAEFLLVDSDSFRPLWHPDLDFRELHDLVAEIPFSDLAGDFSCLKLEAPHRRASPFVVEGYHVPNHRFEMVDLLPKGIEIRTPRCSTIEDCVRSLGVLFERLRGALASFRMLPVALSHHPLHASFCGPQNKRRFDFWQWAMSAMTTYGPDINISLPPTLRQKFCAVRANRRFDHDLPALAALSYGSPFVEGKPWRPYGKTGLSYRTYKRSTIAPVWEFHPDQDDRIEIKPFEMATDLRDYQCYFLLSLAVLLDQQGPVSSPAARVYEAGANSYLGITDSPFIRSKLGDFFLRARENLARWGFDATPLQTMEQRLETGRLPAHDMLQVYERGASMEEVLEARSRLRPLPSNAPRCAVA